MYEYLLPIGSVVRLRGGKRSLMITGVLQSTARNVRRDYSAVTYPEGLIDPRLSFVFDHGDIEEVKYRGYEDQSWKVFVAKLEMASKADKEKNRAESH